MHSMINHDIGNFRVVKHGPIWELQVVEKRAAAAAAKLVTAPWDRRMKKNRVFKWSFLQNDIENHLK